MSEDDEALLAVLLEDDPGDFHAQRARLWRFGGVRWSADGPELAGRPDASLGDRELAQPLDVVVVDADGPRVILPLDAIAENSPDAPPAWSALRIVGIPRGSDLIAGLRHELTPTPWLAVAAGVAVTPVEQRDEQLQVRWFDPTCGFGLSLAIDPGDFGPLYEPGPAGSPNDPPSAADSNLGLVPGASIYASADAGDRDPLVQLMAEDRTSPGERLNAAQRVTLAGPAQRGRRPVELRCRGVVVRGWAEQRDLVERPASYSVVQAGPLATSTCDGRRSAAPMLVPRATPLYAPGEDGELVGVVTEDVELAVEAGADGWWHGCVPSPWGDLAFRFAPR